MRLQCVLSGLRNKSSKFIKILLVLTKVMLKILASFFCGHSKLIRKLSFVFRSVLTDNRWSYLCTLNCDCNAMWLQTLQFVDIWLKFHCNCCNWFHRSLRCTPEIPHQHSRQCVKTFPVTTAETKTRAPRERKLCQGRCIVAIRWVSMSYKMPYLLKVLRPLRRRPLVSDNTSQWKASWSWNHIRIADQLTPKINHL